jgi:hypothetical protein
MEGCDNFMVPEDEECIFEESFGHLLLREAFSSAIKFSSSVNSCPSEFSSVNNFYENECYKESLESSFDSQATYYSQFSIDNPYIDDPNTEWL